MPQASEKLPITLLRVTTSVVTTVLTCSGDLSVWRDSSTGADANLVACVGRDGRPPRVRHEFLSLGAKGHVLAGFLGEALAVRGVEDRFSHHAPDDTGAEVILAVETLHPVDQLGAV